MSTLFSIKYVYMCHFHNQENKFQSYFAVEDTSL